MRYGGDGTATIVGRHNRDNVDVLQVGERLQATESSAVGRVLRTGAPARIDDWGGVRGGEIAEAIFRVGYRSSAAAPIVVAGALWGAVAITSEDPLPADTEDRLGAFCELVSLAVASAQARADLIASRARLVEAGDEQRRRLERNLHDGAQQHLVSVAVKLRVARTQLEHQARGHGAAARGGAERARHRARGAARDRARPASRDPRRARALPRARGARRPARRSTSSVDVLDERLPGHTEATAYYIVSESLTNVAKHAEAGRARVRVQRDGDLLRCEISDDGRGGADPAAGGGLVGLRDRAEAAGGTLTVISPPGRGTVVTASLPL